MNKDEIIGLPAIVSRRNRIVIDKSLRKLCGMEETCKVFMLENPDALYIYPDTCEMPNAQVKSISIGRFNLPALWALKHHICVGNHVYLMLKEGALCIIPAPEEDV